MRKHFLLGAVLLVPLAIAIGCGGDDDPADPGGGQQLPTGSLSGVVATTGGVPLEGMVITVPDKASAQTNEQGYFAIAELSVGEMTITISGQGYLSVYRNISVLANQTTHLERIAMVTVENGTVPSATGGSVTTGDGDGQVNFAAGSFVTADGTSYNGDVNVEISAMLPTDSGFMDAFPGEFEGLREDGSIVPFISYGYMGVDLTDGSKSVPLQLADGATAELRLQVSEGFAKFAPETIPMWYFDPETGTWIEEGEAVMQGSQYVTNVSHFTIWNWDFPVEDIRCFSGTVHDNQGRPVADARVIAVGVSVTIGDEVYTDSEGNFCVRVLCGETFQIRAIKGSYGSDPVEVDVDCEGSMTLEYPLELLEPAFSITLQWGEEPTDLDSHLFIPATWTEEMEFYHIVYWNPGDLTDDPFTELDTDDTSSYGPEVISGFQLYEGTYQYWVHNYSGEDSHPLHLSGATVTLQIPGFFDTYSVADVNLNATEFRGEWHVFDMTVSTSGNVNVMDVMRFEHNPEVADDKGHARKKTQ